MNRWWWILPFLGVALWWFAQDPEPQVAPSRDVIKTLPPVTKRPLPTTTRGDEKEFSPPVETSVVVASRADEPSVREYHQPPAGMVEFQVAERDLVVGFGDIVLGRLPEGTKVPKGITPAPKNRLWPSPRVPFQIQAALSPQTVTAIHEAIAYFKDHSPVRFEPANPQDKDLVVFVQAEKLCGSYLGRMGGAQPIYVSEDCGRQEVIHELMHALGFVHEQSREDRDQFVEIVWSSIEPEFWPQFGIVPEDWVHEYRGSVFDFDYESAMLYGPKSFVRSADLVSLKSRGFQELKPNENGLSRRDLERLYYLYGR